MEDGFFVGVDVGTGSARAGVFDAAGALKGTAKHDIDLFRDGADIAEHSSANIWACVSAAVRDAVAAAGIAPDAVKGVGFDATCSLVVVDPDGQPLTVSATGDPDRNVIVWMDHRAKDQAKRINATSHPVLDYVGGTISPEMETPKLLWLKENLPNTFNGAGDFFDLTDFLTWRATGDKSRSACTVTCKWTYLAHENRWDPTYFEAIGLDALRQDDFARIGTKVVAPGTALGQGLTTSAAADLGLSPGTPVAAGLIDAHAGGVGTIGAAGASPESRMAYVFGTSACTMSSSAEKAFVPGVWGPYFNAMVPGLWLSEGGQSAAGEAIAHLLKLHPEHAAFRDAAAERGMSLPEDLAAMVSDRDGAAPDTLALAGQLLVVPEFLGNRAPFADPDARGIVSGLALTSDLDSLIGLYVAGIFGLGYGLRQILDAQRAQGIAPGTVVISGGAARHGVVKQMLADAANIPVAAPGSDEPVLLGSAMLGAVACGAFPSLNNAMAAMSRLGEIHAPSAGTEREHALRYSAFAALQTAARQLHEGAKFR